MNFLKITADMLHLLSFFIILYKILSSKNCKGVSCKTQEIYLIVFIARYNDLFFEFFSIYNTAMKVMFLLSTFIIIVLMRYEKPYKDTYDRNEDHFPHFKVLIPFGIIMSLLLHDKFTLQSLLNCFSLWLEAVAIFPQISLITKTNSVEKFTAHYIAALGSYRVFYLIYWTYRYLNNLSINWVSVSAGILQSLLYADFFYVYIKNLKRLTSDLPLTMSETLPLKNENENKFIS